MAEYMVFAGRYYYANGGFSDFIGKASTLEEVKELIKNKTWNNEDEWYEDDHEWYEDDHEWFQIVDINTMELVCKGTISIDDNDVRDSLTIKIMSGEFNG